jgi:hypothetical protein
LKSDGAIEDAVLAMLKGRNQALVQGLPMLEEWEVYVSMADGRGYEIFVREHIFTKYAEKNATEPMIVRSLVSFVFGLIEADLCCGQVSSKMVS